MRIISAATGSWLLRSVVPVATVVVSGLAAASCSEAESRDTPGGEEVSRGRTVPTGTSMAFVVDRTVSTETDEAGARFSATLQTPVLDTEGATTIPAGATSTWIVTESSTQDGQSLLGVRLESVQVGGQSMSVKSTVTDATIDTDHPDTGGETAAKIGIGAAAGAIVGQIVGHDTKATLAGAGVGAAVGTAVALSTRGGHATLPAGSRLVVHLDEPLSIR